LRSWQGRLFWLVVLIGPIWLLDRPICELRLHDRKLLLLGDVRDATRQFGQPMGIAWIAAALWYLDSTRRRPLMVALLATAIAWGMGSGANLLIGRERPKVSAGRTIIQGPHWPGTMDPESSFPAGHTTIAFAFAFGLGRMYGQHRALWLALATVCGASRALGESHFASDLVVGAWLGWEAARLVWVSVIGRLLMCRLDQRIPHTAWLPRWDWGLRTWPSAGMP
jgi:membrane-associated phospholipid phosphatase